MERLDQSHLISRAFVFQPQGPCVDQSLNPDRCPPCLLRGIPLEPRELLSTLPKWEVHVPPVREIVRSQTSPWGVSSDLRLLTSTLENRREINCWLLTPLFHTGQSQGSAAGCVGGLVTQEGLAKNCGEGGSQTASRKPETSKRSSLVQCHSLKTGK